MIATPSIVNDNEAVAANAKKRSTINPATRIADVALSNSLGIDVMTPKEMLQALLWNQEQIRRELLELRFAVERLGAQSSAAYSDPVRRGFAHHQSPATASHPGPWLAEASFAHHGHTSESPVAVWIYRSGSWQLDATSVPEGVFAGDPPNIEGSFEGHCVKTECR